MSFIKLCQTREVIPQEIEHYLNAHRNKKQVWVWNKKNLFVRPKPFALFTGASFYKDALPLASYKFYLTQKSSPLLPIKRYRQFEDRDQKLRLYPCDFLIEEMQDADSLHISFELLSEKRQAKIRKWARNSDFNPEYKWDSWESRTWHKVKFRNFLGKIFRWSRGTFRLKNLDPKQSTKHESEGPIEAMLDKLSRPLFKVQIKATKKITAFSESFNLPHLGQVKWQTKPAELILSSEELATILSMPSVSKIKNMNSEACAWLEGNTFIPKADRLKHLHIIGKTGMGKSTAILELFAQDLNNFDQIMIIDPHGDLIENAKYLVPQNKNLIILDPSNREYPLAINPLELKFAESLEQRSSSLLEMFFALSNGSWGPRLEYILRNTLLTLLLCPNTTIMDIPLLLTQKEKTIQFSQMCKDLELQRFWNEEFLNLDQKARNEMIAPILNKVCPLFSTPLLRNIFCQPKAKFSFEEILEKPAVILIPLHKGLIGEDASRLLGMIFVSLLHGSLLQRKSRIPLALTLDEFQNFATPTLMTMLSESRKFGLALTLAHQYIKQVPEEIMDAVLGNVGSHYILRTCYEDAEKLAPLLGLETEDLINLPELNAYLKILHNGQPQSAVRHKLKINKNPPLSSEVFQLKQNFGRPRTLVEAKLKERYNKMALQSR